MQNIFNNRGNMKTSDRILLFLVIGLYSLVIIIVLASRIYLNASGYDVGKHRNPKDEGNSYTITPKEVYQFTDFYNISATGPWKVTLTKGSQYTIKIETSDRIRRNVSIRKQNTTLSLALRSGIDLRGDDLQAIITIPEIKSIRMRGVTEIELYDFVTTRLKITSSGVGTIKGENNQIEELNLHSSGVSRVDLKESKLDNAYINVSGTGSITLNMNGGRLAGNVRGATRLTYYGTVGNYSIKTSGVASIQHKD
jgi:hypothetical protein